MRFAYVRIVTDRLSELVDFYGQVLGVEPEGNEVFKAFRMEGADLALFSRAAAAAVHGDDWIVGSNRGVIVEFRVDDVDAEYARLTPLVRSWIHGPKDMPWGNRSIMFRDPEGNAVNFFRPPEA